MQMTSLKETMIANWGLHYQQEFFEGKEDNVTAVQSYEKV